MINFKGFVYLFSSSLEYDTIGHLVVANDKTLELTPLSTKIPLQYCQLLPNSTTEPCRPKHEANTRQVLSFPIYIRGVDQVAK